MSAAEPWDESVRNRPQRHSSAPERHAPEQKDRIKRPGSNAPRSDHGVLAGVQMTMECYGHPFPSPDHQNAMAMVEAKLLG